jgi:DMSO reductase anchor subunit
MKPAFSVIFFTVSSGAGLGLLLWALLSAGLRPASLSSPVFLTAASLVILGLCASGLHLANRKNAVLAWRRFATSWLSREAVFAVTLFAWPLLWWLLPKPAVLALLCLNALLVLICTGMIYACLKTIPRWHSRWVPVNFVLYAALSGGFIYAAFEARATGLSEATARALFALVLLTACCKMAYEETVANVAKPNLNDALGLHAGKASLLDVGHSHSTFLTREFGFAYARRRAAALQLGVTFGVFVLPCVLLVLEIHNDFGALGLAALAVFIGLLCERSLFFAQAKHVVVLYHGQRL